jgi:hypothetical protein
LPLHHRQAQTAVVAVQVGCQATVVAVQVAVQVVVALVAHAAVVLQVVSFLDTLYGWLSGVVWAMVPGIRRNSHSGAQIQTDLILEIGSL